MSGGECMRGIFLGERMSGGEFQGGVNVSGAIVQTPPPDSQ